MQYKTLIFKSILGNIECIFQDEFLVKLSIRNNKDKFGDAYRETYFIDSDLNSDGFNTISSPLSEELRLYFKGELTEFKQPFKLIGGTPFEHAVWLTLREIPSGQTRTYKWLAEKIRRPLSYRAVGQALAKNPLPLILPCHRVIASDGSEGGFSAGIEIKRWLLRHESMLKLKDNAEKF